MNHDQTYRIRSERFLETNIDGRNVAPNTYQKTEDFRKEGMYRKFHYIAVVIRVLHMSLHWMKNNFIKQNNVRDTICEKLCRIFYANPGRS